MSSDTRSFYFDRTELFSKISKIESILGEGSFDIQEFVTRINSIEQTLTFINSTYTTRTYVDNQLITKVSKTGDTLLGNLALLAEPIENNHIVTKEYVENLIKEIIKLDIELLATKAYVDSQLANKVSKFGGRLYGELILSGDATEPLHPVSKQQLNATLITVVMTGSLDW